MKDPMRSRGVDEISSEARVIALLQDEIAVRMNILRGVINIPPDLVWLHDTAGPVADLRTERDAALARAEKAEAEIAGVAEVLTKNDVPRARTYRNMSLAERVQLVCTTVEIVSRNADDAAEEALARNRALEEGLRQAREVALRDAADAVDQATGSEVAINAIFALLAPASPETTDGKDAT